LATHQTYEELKSFLLSKTGLRMSHIYKPAMLLAIIRSGGHASKAEIAREFLLRDTDQIEYYRKKVVHLMPGKRLVRLEHVLIICRGQRLRGMDCCRSEAQSERERAARKTDPARISGHRGPLKAR
jgi:hypothetical protein